MKFQASGRSHLHFADAGSRFRNIALRAAVSFLLAVLLSPALHAQGCTQCLDNTAATPPKTQSAYRHAIILMTLTGASLFIGTLVLLKRHR